MSTVEKAAVIGAGVMGHGIAQLLAMAGINVSLVDINDEILRGALEKIKWSLGKLVEKRKIEEKDADAIISRIKLTVDLKEAVEDIDFMIECVPEKLELKKQIFSKVDGAAPRHAILSTNTSSLSITEISRVTARADKVVGMHFFNPPILMQLVEVIKGEYTSDETINLTVSLAKRLGKTPVICRKDVRGFIVNRIFMAANNEGYWTVYRGEATKEEVDAAMIYKARFPMGIFLVSDYAGLDIAYEVGKVLGEAYGARARLCPILEELVERKELGQKTKKGFYDWGMGRPEISPALADKFDYERVYAVAINEAAYLIEEDVADQKDIDTAIKLGLNWPLGPCELGDRLGLDSILNKLRELYSKYKDERYRPCRTLEDYVSKGWLGQKTKKGFYVYQ